MKKHVYIGLAAISVATFASAGATTVTTFETLTEGHLGASFTLDDIDFHSVNNVDGFFPDGEPFMPDDVGENFLIEDASLFYNDFPGWGSAQNALSFGNAFIPGDNLSIGAFVTTMMDLNRVANDVSFDMAYYERGPWGGIEFHLDAYSDGSIVGSDMITLASGDGRDVLMTNTMSISGVEFDSLHLYATLNGEFTAPRLMIDNLAVTAVPAPGAAVTLAVFGGFSMRRRRR